VEFTYNNSYEFTIVMTPFKAYYKRPCRSSSCWLEVGDNKLLRLEFIQDTSENVEMIKGMIPIIQGRQTSYADA